MNWWENDPLASGTAVAEPPQAASWWSDDPLAEPTSEALPSAGPPAEVANPTQPEPAAVFPPQPNPEWQPARIPQETIDREAERVAALPPGPERDEAAANLDEMRYANFSVDAIEEGRGQLHAPARRIIGALGNLGRTLSAAVLRGIGGDDAEKMADDLTRERGYINRFLAERDAESMGDVGATVGSVGQSLAEVTMSGGYGMIPYLFASNADSAYVAAKDAGQDEQSATLHGINTGVIQAGLTYLFGKVASKLGGATAEEALTNPAIQHAAERLISKHGLQKLGLAILVEGGEEGTIAALQQLEDMRAGTGDGRDFFKNIGKAAAIGGLAGGAVHSSLHGITKALDRFTREAETAVKAVADAEKFAESATPEQLQAAANATSRGAFTQATGMKNTTREQREAFTEEVKRRLAEQQQQPVNESEPPLFEGNWRKVYHGTTRQYDGPPTVAMFKDGDVIGVYFTESADQAKRWGGWDEAGNTARVIEAEVDLRNPAGKLDKAAAIKELELSVGQDWTPRQLTDLLKSKGFDGIVDDDYIGNEIVVFDDKQIRIPRTDNPAPATKPFQVPISRRQLTALGDRVQKLRDTGNVNTDELDDLLSNDPRRLQDVFDEADRRAAEHNQLMNEARTEWRELFGKTDVPWLDQGPGSDTASFVRKAKKGAASDGDSTFGGWDLIVERVRGDQESGQTAYPNILAAAQSLGNGDVESGLFSLLQESRKYFSSKSADDFVGDVLEESMADATSFDFGANELPIGDSSTFFSGIPLNVRIDLGELGKQATRGVYGLKRFLRKKLTTRGLQNPELKQLNDRRLGQVAKRLKQMKFLQDDLDAAVWGQTGRKRSIPPELRQKLDAALKGEATDLPPELLAPIQKMRAQIDGLSRELQASGIPSDDLQLTIDENLGTYVTRTYAKHSRKDWAAVAKADPQIMADARAALKQEFPADSDEDIEWRINMLLDRDSVDKKPVPEKFVKDAKFQSILMQRKDLPSWLRSLYGENRDPWLNHTLTVTKMAQLMAHEQMMRDVRAAGLAGGWLMEVEPSDLEPQPAGGQQRVLPTFTQKNPQNFRRIDGSESPLLRSLDGLYTDPDTHEALRDMFGPKTMSGLYRWMTTASMIAKWNATVGNSKSYLRNFFGNPAFALANGDLSGDIGKSVRATMADVAGTNDEQMRQYLTRLAELNVIDGEITTAEIKAMMGDLSEAGHGVPLSTSGIGRIVSRGMRSLTNLYQSMDTFWKINGFESKKRYYRELDPAASDAEIEQRAAEDVRRGYTYYSEVPEGIRQVNRFPLLGNFLSFRSEVVRTTKNIIETARREMASDNPIERRMGRRRMVGMAASVAALPMLGYASKLMFGVSDEDDDDIRHFQAPWTRNSPYLYLSPLEDGQAVVIDLGFADPRSQFVKAIYALMGPGDVSEKAQQSLGELAEPLAEDLLFGRVISLMRNRTQEGREIYNESSSSVEKARRISQYLGEPLLPGTVHQIERIRKGMAGEISASGREYDAATEVAGLIGIRAADVDVAQAFGFKSNDFRRAVRDAEAGIRRALTQRGTVDADETRRSLADFHAQREKFIGQWHEMAMAAIRLGVDPQQVTRTVYSAAQSKKLTAEIMAGKPMPYVPSEDTRALAESAPDGALRLQTYGEVIGATQ